MEPIAVFTLPFADVYLVWNRMVLCQHEDGKNVDYVYFDAGVQEPLVDEAWTPIVCDGYEDAVGCYDMISLVHGEHEAKILTYAEILEQYGYHCPHTRDLFAGVQP